MNFRFTTLLLALIGTFALPCVAQVRPGAEEFNGSPSTSARATATGRIIIKWRSQARTMTASARAQKASSAAGFKLQTSGTTRAELEALMPERRLSADELHQAVAQLASDADVEVASLEYRRKPHRLSSDPLLSQQWYLLGDQPSATHSDLAWDVTQGSASIVVAVLDTGVRPDHPDLQGKLLPGYDFVSNAVVANDGNGVRDDDESDPGDWVTREEVDQNPNDFLDEDCLSEGQPVNSSWHGTRVAGLIAAQTDNATGVAGNAWNTRILPIRVLGKCGGSDFDIIDAMRWAAGIPVDGMTNPTPAQVINLSLGGDGPCTSVYQATINEVTARGVLVVASAGNESGAVSSPANCNGVLGVAGLRHFGTKVGFSNLGPEVGISAPGGNCVTQTGACLYPIVVATNTGTTTPGANDYTSTNSPSLNVGTSFSAPMAASAAALLRSVNTTLTPAQIVLLLKATAARFPVNTEVRTCTIPTAISAPQNAECNCTTDTCGAGMLNTGAAVAAALRPLAVVQTSGTPSIGATIVITGTSSFASQGRTIAAHQWSIANVTGATPTIAAPGSASTTLQIPGESQFTLRLTVTDDQGTQDMKEMSIATSVASPPSTPAPTPPSTGGGITSSGSGGGGVLGWEWLLLAMLALLALLDEQSRRLKSARAAIARESRVPPARSPHLP